MGDVAARRAATAATPSSACARATRPTTRTARPPSSRASSTRTAISIVKGPKLRSWLSRARRRLDRRDDRGARRLAACTAPPARRTSHATASSETSGSGPASAASASIRVDSLSVKSGAGRHHRRPRAAQRRDHHGDGRRPPARARRQRRRRRTPTATRGSASPAGDLKVIAANGPIVVDLAPRNDRGASPRTATSACARSCAARSCSRPRLGDLEVGVGEGTAAYLDVSAAAGHVPTTSTPRPTRAPRPRRSRSAPGRAWGTSRSGVAGTAPWVSPENKKRPPGRRRRRRRRSTLRCGCSTGPRSPTPWPPAASSACGSSRSCRAARRIRRSELDDARRLVEKIVTLGGDARDGARRGPAATPTAATRVRWLLEIEEEAVEALQDCIPYTGQEGRVRGAGAPPRAHDHAQAGTARRARPRGAGVVMSQL